MLRIVYIGTRSALTALPLRALLAAEVQVAAVLMPVVALPGEQVPPLRPFAAPRQLPLPMAGQAPDLAAVARQAQLPLFAVADVNHGDTLTLLHTLAPDAVCVTCFPHRLRSPLLTLPRLGCLNVHPSMLPHYRGPAPIFWALRDGATSMGVTVHLMEHRFDSGPIVRQEQLALPPGAAGAHIDAAWGALGARLLVEALQGLAAGTLSPQAQPGGGSYQSWPTAADFQLDPDWSARHAFNFMRGTSEWNQPYVLQAGDQLLRLRRALTLEAADPAAPALQWAGNSVRIRFGDGRLLATLD